MVGEFINLLKLVKDLVSSKAELDKNYFDNFIDPAWASFEDCHKNYKAAFVHYYAMVDTDDFQIRELLENIKNDEILFSDLRSRLNSMVQNFPTGKMKVKEKFLVEFIASTGDYFDNRGYLRTLTSQIDEEQKSPVMMLVGAVGFAPLHQYLLNKKENNKIVNKKKISMAIMQIIQEMQQRYGRVANAYSILKKELLT